MEKLMFSMIDLMKMLSISRAKLDSIRKKDVDFPKPVDLGERTLRWKADEIKEWIDKQQ